jgi:hypothetical protein
LGKENIAIMAASPFQEYYKRFLKDMDGKRYYKPVYSLQELFYFGEKTGRQQKFSNDLITQRYKQV